MLGHLIILNLPEQVDPLLVVLVLELRHGRAGHGDHRDRGQRRPPHAHR